MGVGIATVSETINSGEKDRIDLFAKTFEPIVYATWKQQIGTNVPNDATSQNDNGIPENQEFGLTPFARVCKSEDAYKPSPGGPPHGSIFYPTIKSRMEAGTSNGRGPVMGLKPSMRFFYGG